MLNLYQLYKQLSKVKSLITSEMRELLISKEADLILLLEEFFRNNSRNKSR